MHRSSLCRGWLRPSTRSSLRPRFLPERYKRTSRSSFGIAVSRLCTSWKTEFWVIEQNRKHLPGDHFRLEKRTLNTTSALRSYQSFYFRNWHLGQYVYRNRRSTSVLNTDITYLNLFPVYTRPEQRHQLQLNRKSIPDFLYTTRQQPRCQRLLHWRQPRWKRELLHWQDI